MNSEKCTESEDFVKKTEYSKMLSLVYESVISQGFLYLLNSLKILLHLENTPMRYYTIVYGESLILNQSSTKQ